MFCEKCGGQVSPEDRACMHCGHIFKKDNGAGAAKEKRGPVQAMTGMPTPKQSQAPKQVEEEKEKISPLWIVANVILGVLIVGTIGVGGWLSFGSGGKVTVQEPREALVVEDVDSEETEVAIDTTIKVEGDGGVEKTEESDKNSDEYMFPNGDSAYLTRADLAGLSDDELRIGRNEFYARHGRKFADPELQAYFESKSWYTPQYEADEMDAMGLSIFNKYEAANIELITGIE